MKTRVFFAVSLVVLAVGSAHAQEEVSGSGTAGTIPVWTRSTRLGNSIITQVNGGIQVSSTSTAITGSTSGPDGSVAISGFANGNSGFVTGVQGVSNSPQGTGGGFVNLSPLGGNGIEGSATGPGIGVIGGTNHPQGVGVQGSSPNVAVAGFSQDCSNFPCTPTAGTAGQFVTGPGGLILQGLLSGPSGRQQFSVDSNGNLFMAGNLTKASGSFKIDHPLDPANKYLSHSFVESPDMKNIYDGTLTTDEHGLATVVLPEYFESLNRDFRYQLTVIGQFAAAIVAKEIEKNCFTIRTDKPVVKVSWQVTGIRRDAYANAHRLKVEEEKPQQERGRYLHPDLFGASETQAIGATRIQPPPVLAGPGGRTAQ